MLTKDRRCLTWRVRDKTHGVLSMLSTLYSLKFNSQSGITQSRSEWCYRALSSAVDTVGTAVGTVYRSSETLLSRLSL